MIATAETPSSTLLDPEIASIPGDGASWIEILQRLVLFVPVLLLPWMLAGVDPFSRVLAILVVSVVQVMALPAVFVGSRHQSVFPALMYPVLLGGLLAAGQLVPLSPAASRFLSPTGSSLWSELSPHEHLPEIDDAPPPETRADTISLYPAATRADLARYAALACLVLLGGRLWWQSAAWRWLCVLVAANGVALAFFGLIQKLSFNGKIYWIIEMTEGGYPFGPFINHNHAGGYLNLCIACTLGAGAYAFQSAPRVESADRSRRSRRPRIGQSFDVSELTFQQMLVIGALLLLAAGLCASLSRGGMLAGLIATIVVTLCVNRGRLTRQTLLLGGGTALLLAAFLAWYGFSELISARVEKGLNEGDPRLKIWPEFLKAVPDYWRTGSGLGTFRYLYPPYITLPWKVTFYHAENQYIEALIEAGLGGLLCLLAALAILTWSSWKLLMRGEGTTNFSFGIAGMYAAVSQAVASFFDFGLYAAANSVLLAVIAGAVAARYFWSRRVTARPEPPPRRWPSYAAAATVSVAGIGVLAWASWEAYRVSRVELVVETAEFDPDVDLSTVPLLYVETLIPRVFLALAPDVVVQGDPPRVIQRIVGIDDDAVGQLTMARLYVLRYRIQALEALRAAQPPPDPAAAPAPDAEDPQLWMATDVANLHAAAAACQAKGDQACLAEVRSRPLVVDSLMQRARKRLLRARRASPLLPETHFLLGELAFLAPTPESDEPHLARAVRMAPADAELLFRVGLLEFQAGRTAMADAHWRRSLELGSEMEGRILDAIGDRRTVDDVLQNVFPESAASLLSVAEKRFQGEEHADLRRQYGRRARELLQRQASPTAEAAYQEGSAAFLEEDYTAAAQALERAIRLSPKDLKPRLLQGRVALAAGRLVEARLALNWCLLAYPYRPDVRRLKAEVEAAERPAPRTPASPSSPTIPTTPDQPPAEPATPPG